MIFEIWDIISLTEGESPQPFTKIFENNDFNKVWNEFLIKIKSCQACIIVNNKESIDKKYKTGEKIYESPDGGKSVYEREILQNDRVRIK